MSKKTNSMLTRRGFIKDAAVGFAGAGAIAFMGLSTKDAKASQPPQKWDRVADLIIVNKFGLRYVNEALPEKPASFYDASLAQEDHVLWAIFDEGAVKRHGWDPRPPTVEKDLAFSAPTIGGLAKLIKCAGGCPR